METRANYITESCDCIPGEFLCPTAEKLRDAATAAYKRAKRSADPNDWQEYEDAREAYWLHAKRVSDNLLSTAEPHGTKRPT